MSRHDDEHELTKFLAELRDPEGPIIVRAGILPLQPYLFWSDRVTDDVVVTRNRRQHYLERHVEIIVYEELIVPALLNPDEVHRNAVDTRMAIVYSRIDDVHHLRIPVWMSDRHDRQNSVMSLRLARQVEVEMGAKKGRSVWKK